MHKLLVSAALLGVQSLSTGNWIHVIANKCGVRL